MVLPAAVRRVGVDSVLDEALVLWVVAVDVNGMRIMHATMKKYRYGSSCMTHGERRRIDGLTNAWMVLAAVSHLVVGRHGGGAVDQNLACGVLDSGVCDVGCVRNISVYRYIGCDDACGVRHMQYGAIILRGADLRFVVVPEGTPR